MVVVMVVMVVLLLVALRLRGGRCAAPLAAAQIFDGFGTGGDSVSGNSIGSPENVSPDGFSITSIIDFRLSTMR